MQPHFLDALGGTSIGFGKPFRGIISTTEVPQEGVYLAGIIEANERFSPIYTSTVAKTLRVTEGDADGETIWLIETRNSVYVVRQSAD
jgi:hypothetical protein